MKSFNFILLSVVATFFLYCIVALIIGQNIQNWHTKDFLLFLVCDLSITIIIYEHIYRRINN